MNTELRVAPDPADRGRLSWLSVTPGRTGPTSRSASPGGSVERESVRPLYRTIQHGIPRFSANASGSAADERSRRSGSAAWFLQPLGITRVDGPPTGRDRCG